MRGHLEEVRREDADWIHLTHKREKRWAVVNTVMKLRVTYNAGNFWASLETFSLSRNNLLQKAANLDNDQNPGPSFKKP
jgi:hypothetical protein